jgi:hypothetical protein
MSLRQDLIEAGGEAICKLPRGEMCSTFAEAALDAMLDLLTTSEWPSQYTRDLLAVLRNPGSQHGE